MESVLKHVFTRNFLSHSAKPKAKVTAVLLHRKELIQKGKEKAKQTTNIQGLVCGVWWYRG